MHSAPQIKKNQGQLCREAILLLGLLGLCCPATALEMCDLKYEVTDRGEWAMLIRSGEHFVFRTQRRQLEPPAFSSIVDYHEVAEAAALEALESHVRRKLSVGSAPGSLHVSRGLAQTIPCNGKSWTLFSYNLASVNWKKTEAPPPQSAPPLQTPSPILNAPIKAVTPVAAKPPSLPPPPKSATKILTTIEE